MREGLHRVSMLPGAAIGFRPAFLDFNRGIHVGNLDENERITRILKIGLEKTYREPFVTERWGRGVFWQWIGFLPRANRSAMPLSSHVSFGCSKFFLMMDTEERKVKCGLQVERGYIRPPRAYSQCRLAPDWDWHRLLGQLRNRSPLEKELRRLVLQEDFLIHAGNWEAEPCRISKGNFPKMSELRQTLETAPKKSWAGFQLYYAFSEEEVQASSGVDLVESMLAVFAEVTPAMNFCMQIRLEHNPASA